MRATLALAFCVTHVAGAATAGDGLRSPRLLDDLRSGFAAARALRASGDRAGAGARYSLLLVLVLDSAGVRGDWAPAAREGPECMSPCRLWRRVRASGLLPFGIRALLNAILSFVSDGDLGRAWALAIQSVRWTPVCFAPPPAPHAAGPCLLPDEAQYITRLSPFVVRGLAARSAPRPLIAACLRAVVRHWALAPFPDPEPTSRAAGHANLPPASHVVDAVTAYAQALPAAGALAVREAVSLLPIGASASTRAVLARARGAPARVVASFEAGEACLRDPDGGCPPGRGADHLAAVLAARAELEPFSTSYDFVCDAARLLARHRAHDGDADGSLRALRLAREHAGARCPRAGEDIATLLSDLGRADEAVPLLLDAARRGAAVGGDRHRALGAALRACLLLDPMPVSLEHAAERRGAVLAATRCAVRALGDGGGGAGRSLQPLGSPADLAGVVSALGAGLPHFSRYYHGGSVAAAHSAASRLAAALLRRYGAAPAAVEPTAAPCAFAAAAGHGRPRSPGAVCRVVVASAHIRAHSVSRFLLPLLLAAARVLPRGVTLHVVHFAAVRPRYGPAVPSARPADDAVRAQLDRALAARGDGSSAVVVLQGGVAEAGAAVAALRPHALVLPDLGMDSLSWLLAAARAAPLVLTTWGHPVTSGGAAVDAFVLPDPLHATLADVAGASPRLFTEPVVALPAAHAAAVDCPPPEGGPAAVAAWARAQAAPAPALRRRLGVPPRAPLLACVQAAAKVSPPFAAMLGAALHASGGAGASAARLLLLAPPRVSEAEIARAYALTSPLLRGRGGAGHAAGAAESTALRLGRVLGTLRAGWAAARLGASPDQIRSAAAEAGGAAAWPGPAFAEPEESAAGGEGADCGSAAVDRAGAPDLPADAVDAVRRCAACAAAAASAALRGQRREAAGCTPWHALALLRARQLGIARGRRPLGHGGGSECEAAAAIVAVAVPAAELRRRVTVLPRQPRATFEALLFAADVIVDSFPVSGGVTTLDSVARGAPLVSWPAAQTTLRFTRAFLARAGRAEWAVADPRAFVSRIAALARSEPLRRALRISALAMVAHEPSRPRICGNATAAAEGWTRLLGNMARRQTRQGDAA